MHDLLRRGGGGKAKQRLRRLRKRDLLERAREHAAAGRDERAVVVLPARARQIEQPPAFGETPLGIGRWIDKDVAVIERGDKLQNLFPQHAVAEDVARHVAHADDR